MTLPYISSSCIDLRPLILVASTAQGTALEQFVQLLE